MRTEQLIDALARDPTPVDAGAARRRFALLLALGPLAALVLMMVLLRPRPDLAAAIHLPMFWLKVLWPAVVAVAACVLLDRLAHPGAKLGGSPAAALAPTVLVVLMGAVVLWSAEPADRLALLLGQTWYECPFLIALLSVPALGLALRALRGFAPTRLPLAGAAAGLFAGAAAAFAYAFHCPEMQAPFLAVWYVLGMLIPAAVGAALGQRMLRW